MRVFNRHVSTRGLTVFALRDAADLGLDRRRGAPPRLASDSVGALEGRPRDGAVRALLLLQRPLRPDARALEARAARAGARRPPARRRSCWRVLSLVLPSVQLGNGTFVIDARHRSSSRCRRGGSRSTGSRATRTSRSGCSSSARGPARADRRQPDARPARLRLPAGRLHRRSRPAPASAPPARCSAPIADLPRIVEAYAIDRIVVGLADRRGQLPIDELLQAKLSGVASRTRRRPTSGSPARSWSTTSSRAG